MGGQPTTLAAPVDLPAGDGSSAVPAGVSAGTLFELGDQRGEPLGQGLEPSRPVAAFDPPAEPFVPAGPRARYDANAAALRTLRDLRRTGATASPEQQLILSRWTSWGAIPEVFDDAKPEWSRQRDELRELLTDKEWAQARRTTLNAHYTSPEYVTEVWGALRDLGFDGGAVLEPGSGSGTFIGHAPSSAAMTGVELDPVTADISRHLYPLATIRSESFADTRIPSDYFDATVGNVPFGKFALHDPIDNANGHSIHNHFILKSLRLTRPGGIVAVLTSHFTLDQANPAARREMAMYGDLLGAVRLPTGAHKRTAGTEAVTDLLIFRRRDPNEPAPSDRLWEGVTAHTIDGATMKINTYFDRRPENVLGTLHVTNGMHGSQTLQVVPNDLEAVPRALHAALERIVAEARESGRVFTPRQATAAPVIDLPDPDAWDGTIHALEDGTFAVSTRSGREPMNVPKSAAAEMRALLALRTQAVTQLAMERASLDDTAEILAGRRALRSQWEKYVARFGPINRYKETPTGRVDEDGNPIMSRRVPTATRLLRTDPFGPLVMALEVFDENTQRAEPAALLERRVILPRPDKLGADTPSDALNLSLNRNGTVDLDYIAEMLGDSPEEARRQLGELVYDDPETGTLIPAAEYLSGDVRSKLASAADAATTDPRFESNVRALEQVLPTPLTPEEITARVGAVWISPAYHQEFLRELLNDPQVTVSNPLPATWKVRDANRRSVRATSDWGTERRPATDLFERLANQVEIKVEDEYEDADGRTRKVLNPTETAAAQEKAALLQERFEEWVWEDPARARSLSDEYNRRFNSTVLRSYDGEGAYLTFPGMAASFQLRPHQRAAVARMLREPAVGLFHEVGAGKTAEMVTGAMELRRMGLATKIGVVVPNHMLEQFTREWLQIYPQARILAANSEQLTRDKRRLFVARASSNDWDAVILTREAFRRLPVEAETATAFLDHEVQTLQAALADATGEDRMTVKQIEKRLAALEEKQKNLLDQERDPGITFESTGIDYLVVDEFHDYKNLSTTSKTPDANIQGSERATDMAMKLEYLRNTHGARVVTVATATPIANSITEAHVMQRYLRPDLLRKAGVEAFDAWAATFGQQVTDVEMAPQGGGAFRLKTRFAKFVNVPEMLRMWHVFADVKTAEDLNLPVPALQLREDGKRLPQTVALTAGDSVMDYVADLGERAERIQQRIPREINGKVDNMLWVSSDGRKAAVDYRLVDQYADVGAEPIALHDVAENIARIYHQNKHNTYRDTRTGEPSPVPGALQIVFCDLGTPSEKWNAYDELKLVLTQRGVPADGIRFVHEAKNDAEKARLFSAAREGGVAVLIGSTAKMGVGTNVQARAIALHDVDCPWRPADVAQRHGRIIRQGNQNPEVGIFQYVTTGTFSAYMWQAIERKSKFINQVMRGRLDVREMQDLGDDSLSAAEAKALASGNPLLLERSIAINESSRLERLERAWQRNRATLEGTIRNADQRIGALNANLAAYAAAAPRVRDLAGDNFRISIYGRHCDKRVDAAAALVRWAGAAGIHYARPGYDTAKGVIGEISGFPITARTRTDLGTVFVEFGLEGIPAATVKVDRKKLTDPEDIGAIRMLEHRIANLPTLIEHTKEQITAETNARAEAVRSLSAPFKHGDALQEARTNLERIDAQLRAMTEPKDPQPENAPAADPDPTTRTGITHTGPDAIPATDTRGMSR